MVAIQTPLQTTIVTESTIFSHKDAEQITRYASVQPVAKKVIIDLAKVESASTSAFARLIVFRRHLLKNGRDLRLANLSNQARALYEISRLDGVLPLV